MNGQEVIPQRFHPIMLGFEGFLQLRSGAPRPAESMHPVWHRARESAPQALGSIGCGNE